MKQPENAGSTADLMKYRLEKAESDIKAAKILIEAEEYRSANNRAYYAIFHAISAVHAIDGKSYKKHKDAIGNFNKDYVKTEIFPKETGRRIAEAEEIRHASDYDDFYIAVKDETLELLETAEALLSQIKNYCQRRIENS